MFALTEALDETLQAPIRRTLEQRLDAFLKTFAKNFRPVREVVAQKAFFGAHLVGGKKQGHDRDAHD